MSDSEKARAEARRRAVETAVNGQAPAAGSPAAAEQEAYDIILQHWRETHRPAFRRGSGFLRDGSDQVVKKSDLTSGAGRALLNKLAHASNRPRSRNGSTDRNGLPRFFRDWASDVWVDLLASLGEEDQTAEICPLAEEEFREKVAAGLHTHVTLGYRVAGEEETRTERRSLVSWAEMFAKVGGWAQVRTYLLWGRREPAPEGKQVLRLGLRVLLFSQIGLRGLAGMNQHLFSRLAIKYAVGTAQKVNRRTRIIELDADFVAELLARPQEPTETGDTSPLGRAGARDSVSSSPEEDKS